MDKNKYETTGLVYQRTVNHFLYTYVMVKRLRVYGGDVGDGGMSRQLTHLLWRMEYLASFPQLNHKVHVKLCKV